MKHCPECNRNYADPTLRFCLQDGAPLIFGSAVNEIDNDVLPEDFPSEAPTRQIDPHTTYPTESLPYPETPAAGSRSRNKLVWLIGGIAVLVALAVFAAFRYYNSAGSNQIDSIAVLPFENGSGNPELDYLSDGVSETLIDKLSQLPQLKVISRNSSFKYRGKELEFKDIAAKLGVRAIVTGKVTKLGDDLSVRVEMIDGLEDRQIWSEQYNRKAADIFAIQKEIAQEAADELRVKLTGAQEEQLTNSGTNNPQAYELLLKGRFYRNKPITEESQKAIDYFEKAVAADPSYALAYADLAEMYRINYNNSVLDPKEFAPKAEAAAQRAVELDDTLAEGHMVRGNLRMNAWDWKGAEQETKRAIDLNPNLGRAHDAYAEYLSLVGRHDEAIAEAKRARELDPLYLRLHRNLGAKFLNARRYGEAIEALEKAFELDPKYEGAHVYLGYTYAAMGRYREAIDRYERVRRERTFFSPSTQIYLGAAYAGAGEIEKARSILKELVESGKYYSPAELAILYVALGEREQALASLEKAYAERDLQLKYLTTEAGYDPISADPRFRELVRKVGLPE